MLHLLDEQQRRLLAISIANGYGHDGITLVSDTSGIDIRTIRFGIREINGGVSLFLDRTKSEKVVPEENL